MEHVVSVLEKQYPYVEVNSILGIDSAYDQNRKVRIQEIELFSLFLLQHRFENTVMYNFLIQFSY